MKIELISTGDEVVHGEITNTNVAWLAEQCRALGGTILRHVTVADDAAAIGAVCREAAARADVVVASGGLGATVDDITMEAAAAAFGVGMEFRPELWDAIQAFFARVGRPCAENNKRQAYCPVGATALHNRVGTASGVQIVFDRATFFFLPGVPTEMKQIFREHCRPWLQSRVGKTHTILRVLRCVGAPEASLDQALRGLDLEGVRLGFRATFPEVRIKLSAVATDRTTAESLVAAAETRVRAKVGEHVYGVDEETLPGVVGRLLAERRWTLAVAESCTGGYLAHQITNVSGASTYFDRGVVAYRNDAKTALLQISASLLQQHGAVSAETARAMAEGVRSTAKTTVGLAVTGIAGPTGGTPEKPVGTVYLALAHANGTDVVHHCFQRDRLEFKMLVGSVALNLLRKYLLSTEH